MLIRINKKYNYISWLLKLKTERQLSNKALASAAGIPVSALSRVFNHKTHLNREQAFLIGKALSLEPVELEKLALLVVYANARTEIFRKHIRLKLNRVSAISKNESWTSYICSTFPKISARTRSKD